MISRFILSIFIAFFLFAATFGQTGNECSYKPPREAETWCFCVNVQLQFRGEIATPSVLPPLLSFGKGSSSISDENGNLLLFSDGMKLWDKNASQLSGTLDGDLGSTQSSLMVPNPLGNQQYYIFTTDQVFQLPTKGLNYSFIDLSKASGNDTLPVKRLLNETPEKLTGVKHSNGHDYWVVAHGWNNNSFHSYKVTNSGVDSIAIISNVGMIHTGTVADRNSIGYMKISPEGSRLALAVMGANMVEWFDFDNKTGAVSNVRQIPSPDSGKPYGIEFSPDARYLYFTSVNQSTNATNNLYQVDLNTGSTPVLLNQIAHDHTALQLAIDGKIYVARFKKSFLGVIENPNRPGTACNFIEDGLSLNSSISFMGLPNFIQSYFNIPAITYDTKCQGDDTYLYLTNTANIDSISWDFGDPASGASNFDNIIQAFHTFSDSGTYNVKATEWFNNQSFESTVSVKINKLPSKSFESLPDTVYILPGSAYELDGGDFMKTYLWQDGSTAQTFVASQPGNYTVFIVDTNCCQQNDTTLIMFLDLYVPSAFSPNNDLLNDRFRAIGPTQGIDDYHFYVYSQWGQLLWETNNFYDSWDGKIKGSDCPTGVYTWVMKFSVSGLLNNDKVAKRGFVTLLR